MTEEHYDDIRVTKTKLVVTTGQTLENVHLLKVFECIVDILAYLWLL